MEISFISSKTFKERNRKRESPTFFLFGRIYFVNLCFGRCLIEKTCLYNNDDDDDAKRVK